MSVRVADEIVRGAQIVHAGCVDDVFDGLELAGFEQPQDEIGRRLDHVAVDLA